MPPDFPNSLFDLDGFSLDWADRDESWWCSQYTVREAVCKPDVELLCLSLRPFYLPREFGNIIICSAYVSPTGNSAKAASCISDCVHKQLKRTPGAPIFILCYFNHCRLDLSLPGYKQYINCDTRGNKTLDKCYGNVKNAYVAQPKPPLSNCNHDMIHLIPTYRTLLKWIKP